MKSFVKTKSEKRVQTTVHSQNIGNGKHRLRVGSLVFWKFCFEPNSDGYIGFIVWNEFSNLTYYKAISFDRKSMLVYIKPDEIIDFVEP